MFVSVIHYQIAAFKNPDLSRLGVTGAWSSVRLGRYLGSWRKRKLAGYHYGLIGFHAALDHGEVAFLSLAGLHRAKIDSVIGFHHENKRPTLANLDGLCRHECGVLERVQDETNAHKFRRPQRAVGIRRDPASFHCSGAWLHCVVNEVKIARTWSD
jgi:hypothetical protein